MKHLMLNQYDSIVPPWLPFSLSPLSLSLSLSLSFRPQGPSAGTEGASDPPAGHLREREREREGEREREIDRERERER